MKSFFGKEEDQDEQDPYKSFQQPRFQHTFIFNKQLISNQAEKDILSLISKFPTSQSFSSMKTTSHLNNLTKSKQYIENLKQQQKLLRSMTNSRESSSNSNQSQQMQKNRVLEQSESEDEDDIQLEERSYDGQRLDQDEDDEDEEEELGSFQVQEEKDHLFNSESSIKRHKKLAQNDSIKEYEVFNDELNRDDDEDSLISKEQIEQYKKLDPKEKLATFKNYKQTLLRKPTLNVRQFFCEIIYDKVEEEKIIKMKYINKIIGFILKYEKYFPHRYLAKMIEDKEIRQKKIKELFKEIYDSEKFDQNSIPSFISVRKIQQFKDDLQQLLQIKDDEKKNEKGDEILKNLIDKKQEISCYQDNEDFNNLIEQIIIFKAQRFYDYSNSGQLMASFLLKIRMSPAKIFKYLLDNEKLQVMCSCAMDVIRFLSNNPKYDAPQNK